jgi:hypothetical protein
MLKKIVWHLELTLLRRRMRGLHDGRLPHDSELARSTRPAELQASGYTLFPESTAFRELQ